MNERKKNFFILALLIAIIAMSVGYAALAQVLDINGTANITAVWDVRITDIQTKNSVGATNKKIPTYNERTAIFDANLPYPGANITYSITVENKGTVDANLANITGVDEANNNKPVSIKYTIDQQSGDTVLKAGDKTTFDVKVEWDSSLANSIPAITNKVAIINLNYIQK